MKHCVRPACQLLNLRRLDRRHQVEAVAEKELGRDFERPVGAGERRPDQEATRRAPRTRA